MNLYELLKKGSKIYSIKENTKANTNGRKKNTIDGVKDPLFSRAIPHQEPQRKMCINRE